MGGEVLSHTCLSPPFPFEERTGEQPLPFSFVYAKDSERLEAWQEESSKALPSDSPSPVGLLGLWLEGF